jgi:lipopolysaccharide transport system ATP-binding protein
MSDTERTMLVGRGAGQGLAEEMPDGVALSVRGLRKKFCRRLKRSMYYGILDLVQNLVGRAPHCSHLRKDEFWALSDVSFDLHEGERLGIIGLNGSGKTTLLRVLTGIFPPDDGRVGIRGEVSGLIALGAGMHPHMTGRENIYLNGAILGMSREEIDAKFDSIVRFSEQEAFLDAPLSSYSSGMKVKLGFSVAIHREPDVLLIDEVLAVGDYAFVNKSLRMLHEYRDKAKALIYISHNLEQVRSLCDRVVVLDKGAVVFDGEANEAIRYYQDMCADVSLSRADMPMSKFVAQPNLKNPSEKIRFIDFGIMNPAGESLEELGMDDPIVVYCRFEITDDPRTLFFSVGILDEKKTVVIWLMSNDFRKVRFAEVPKGKYEVTATIERHNLMPGLYYPSVAIRDDVTMELHSRYALGHAFAIKAGDKKVIARGLVSVDEKWAVRPLADEEPETPGSDNDAS